ncbi:oligosaccharide flippase family protein [uncultured Vibrio sp.]|uniref:oligosaccharide flippase family protein n=1 Tax=uncultured Vibrio sp. TaxID=114054 RepID=UPI00260AC550|nr:oligosaccharide flippase family protein [uncultured Vibrio sp.]
MNKIVSFSIGPIGGALLGFITLPIIAWHFSSADIGKISLLQVMISFCTLFFTLGLDQSYTRYYHDSNNRNLLFSFALIPTLIFFIVPAIIVLLFFPGYVSDVIFDSSDNNYDFLILFSLLCALLSRLFSLIPRMKGNGLVFSFSQIIPRLVFFLIILTYIFVSLPSSFVWLLFAKFISLLVTLVFLIYKSDWKVTFKKLNEEDLKNLKGMMLYGSPLVFAAISSWALMAIDKVAIRSYSTFEELGVYSVAISFASVAGVLGAIFNTLWAPTVFKWSSEGKNLDKVGYVSRIVQLIVVLTFCFVGLFSWVAVYVLPEEYFNVSLILPMMISVPLFYALSETTSIGISLKKKTYFSLLSSVIAALCNVVGNYLLVPNYGAIGASISTILSMFIFFIVRTEISSAIWLRVSGIKSYFLISISILSSILFSLLPISLLYSTITWLLIFLLCVFLYKDEISSLRNIRRELDFD